MAGRARIFKCTPVGRDLQFFNTWLIIEWLTLILKEKAQTQTKHIFKIL